MTDRNNILYMFDRPNEPSFTKKGDNEVAFDVPAEFFPDRYKPLAANIRTRFNTGNNIAVKKLSQFPDLSFPLGLKRNEHFSIFNSYHSQMAAKLIEILYAAKSFDELMSLTVYCRDRINPYMFVYALAVVLAHRPDTRDLPLPSHAEMFPNMYMDSAVIGKAVEESAVVAPGQRTPIEISNNFTHNDLDMEHRVSYFREDVGINLHHWHWHLVYPHEGPSEIVNKDRRGELFYYAHQQIIARYNMERLCNDMNRVIRLNNWREPILEAYFSKLDTVVANRVWAPRPANATLQDINREADRMSFDIEDLERWRDRIFNAIHSGFIIDSNGNQVKLDKNSGIDILGNIVEASILSRNRNLYGSLHNEAHNAIAFIHDPDNRFLENQSVMGEPSTAMRDPVFYRLHAYINDMFLEFKATLPGYTAESLNFDNVKVQSVEINATGVPRNEFYTFWDKSNIELSRGLDFVPRGSIYARITHLQHIPFNFKIIVENNGNQRMGTVRLFIAPKFDERGVTLLFSEQKNLFVELDRFSVQLTKGRNEIVRRSADSSVTIPHDVTFRNLDNNRPAAGSQSETEFNFCGCGWPQHMLIPKGTSEGYPCQLFVMITNGFDDQVDNAKRDKQTCDNASSYCGIRNDKYPDARPMGYPFDRRPRDGVITLQQFLTPNMGVQDVRIKFKRDRPTANEKKTKPK